jgi:hypothetical protein
MKQIERPGQGIIEVMHIRSGLRAGRIICYDDSSGYLVEVLTPCSTPITYPTPPPSTPGVQWLSCNSCSGTSIGQGRLQSATCDICTL